MSLEPINYDPIQNIFCNYIKSDDIDDKERSSYILACDEGILKLKDILNINVDDNTYLTDNFDLINNIRYTVDNKKNPTTTVLNIYSKYLMPIFTSNLKEGSDSRFILVDSLSGEDIKRQNYYSRYIITFAVTAKFIALHNKQILMKQMKDLLRFIVIKLYKCYNRIYVAGRVSSVLKGGALYLSTDEDMKKIEGQIIVLYNLYITNSLSVEDLINKYSPTPHNVVVNLSNIFVALLLSSALLGAVTAAVVMPPAGSIALTATASAVGMCYTQHRGKFQSAYCTSADTNEIITKLYKEFDLTVGDCDSCVTEFLNSQLRHRYDEIQRKINQFVGEVNTKYDKYNRIFNFIIENNTIFLPPNKCELIPLPPPINEVDEKIKGYLNELKTVVETDIKTWAQNTEYTNAIDKISENFPGQKCSPPTTKAQLRALISNIEIRQGTDLLNYVKQILLCKDTSIVPSPQELRRREVQYRENTQNFIRPELGGRKSRKRKSRKRKTQKHSRKGKRIRRR
jgi:hypothetical protein